MSQKEQQHHSSLVLSPAGEIAKTEGANVRVSARVCVFGRVFAWWVRVSEDQKEC